MEQLQNLPPVKWSLVHPRIAAWVVLSAGMIILLVIEARDVGLEFGNWVALIIATILVAGACIWIVSWEDVDESDPLSTPVSDAKSTGESEVLPVESVSDESSEAGTPASA